MHIVLVGINHETAPVELREKLAFQHKRLGEALAQLTLQSGHENEQFVEGVILSTCNRVEIYALARNVESGFERIKNFLSKFHHLPLFEFEKNLYMLSNLGVVEHLFAVASGIQSMVLGETQIQGQVKQAFEAAQKHKTVGPILSNLFRSALTVGKRARCETTISEHSLSVSHAAVNLVRKLFHDISMLNILLVGTGKMNVLAAKTLVKLGARKLTIVNRTQERAEELATELGIMAVGFEQLEHCLQQADVVISSTGAPHIILSYEKVEKISQDRGMRPLLIVDIAVPRDVAPEVGNLDFINLYNIDRLESYVDVNMEQRCNEINKVRDIINEGVAEFLAWCQSLEVKPVIADLRHYAEEIREQELERAFRRLGDDLSEHHARVVEDLACRIINKMLHQPIVCLREEAVEGNGQTYTAAIRHLFGLEKQSYK
ncbi:MAG: glutamyl-tRNA reductase [bacterium]